MLVTAAGRHTHLPIGDGRRDAGEGGGVVVFDEQSIYRALRKYYDVELVDFELHDSERGPQRKYYSLTKIGTSVLKQFIERNIKLFQNKSLVNILNK